MYRTFTAYARIALAASMATSACVASRQSSDVAADTLALRPYAGVYQWSDGGFMYLQLWPELTAAPQLVAFEESGRVRVLYPRDTGRFIAGPAAAVPDPVESTVSFQRDSAGRVVSVVWAARSSAARTGRRVTTEVREDVTFANDDVRLAGTLLTPARAGRHPAVILVHASGAEDREYVLPFARFLVRRGIAVLGYDKRGVGGSTGDWRTASFQDLAGDVIAAFDYLKTRADIDPAHVGLLGWSQAGWVMPLAAVRRPDMAFLISVAGAGISPALTTIDQARNEMAARGMKRELVERIVRLMQLQYDYARTGLGWEHYVATRDSLVDRLGRAPESSPASPADAYWTTIRRLYFHDPAPTLRALRVPTLALFGELDNNIVAAKNRAAWESALRAGGHRDYTLRTIPRANHLMMQAKTGSIAEMASLTTFAPEYYSTIETWLAQRVPGFGAR